MKKERQTVMYESPVTRETQVSLESGICSASADIQNPNSSSGQVDAHGDTNFSSVWDGSSGWDSISNN